ncbi:hypothetical protein INT46_000073 [Mucor plumbeus]|uniref:Uncharacterized protein n=1 Tax=Mucor plumbeus TaxID=97098 RepID=A0A8H7QHF8_9FUNG|nr:hypothetical protein INT46_000073 [Mucor plumbeus]
MLDVDEIPYKIAEKPNVNTLDSVISGLFGGKFSLRQNTYSHNLNMYTLILGLAGLAVGHPFGKRNI